MPKRYRHPQLGEFRNLDLSKGNPNTVVTDASLAGLVQYLNEAKVRSGGRKIVRILEEMLALERLTSPAWTEIIDGPMMVMRRGMDVMNPLLKKLAPEKYKLQSEIDNRQFLVNRMLAAYRFTPIALRFGKTQWSVIWAVRPRAAEKITVAHGLVQVNEGLALQMILDFARAGGLSRLRQCLLCKKWFYAKYRHQGFCSATCQQKEYKQSEEWKAKRCLYMRRYRERNM